jgi:hypothetical protein
LAVWSADAPSVEFQHPPRAALPNIGLQPAAVPAIMSRCG